MRDALRIMIGAVSLVLASASANAERKPELTSLELQSIQSKEFECSKDILFASVVSVLQDLGYQLDNADLGSGFVTATSATKNRTSVMEALFIGSRSQAFTRVTAFVESMPRKRSRVRLNFTSTKSTSSAYGQNSRNDKPILDAKVYQVAWDKIDQAIFLRTATDEGSDKDENKVEGSTPQSVPPGTSGSSAVTTGNPKEK